MQVTVDGNYILAVTLLLTESRTKDLSRISPKFIVAQIQVLDVVASLN